MLESDEIHQNDIRDGITADGNNIIAPYCNTLTSTEQVSIEQSLLVGNSVHVFLPFCLQEEEYEIENNPVQSDMVHQSLLEDGYLMYVPANPQEQETNYVSLQNNLFSSEGGIVEENFTPEDDVSIVLPTQN